MKIYLFNIQKLKVYVLSNHTKYSEFNVTNTSFQTVMRNKKKIFFMMHHSVIFSSLKLKSS
jgi:hypothetical protein